jgi:hypothetical protein
MKRRVAEIDGRIEIESGLGATVVTIVLPGHRAHSRSYRRKSKVEVFSTVARAKQQLLDCFEIRAGRLA